MSKAALPLRNSNSFSASAALQTAVIAGVFAVVAAIIGGWVALYTAHETSKYAFDAKMVELGVQILSADPSKSDVASAREWAIELVEIHAGLPFDDKTRESLLHHPIQKFQPLSDSNMPLTFKTVGTGDEPFADPLDYIGTSNKLDDCNIWTQLNGYWVIKAAPTLGQLYKSDPLAKTLNERCRQNR